MKIIQLSDLHVGAPDEMPHGVDVRMNFLEILKSIQIENADLLVITGDFCLKAPTLDAYIWIKSQLDRYTLPYKWIPGNHDDLTLMKEVFDLSRPFPFLEFWEGFQVVFVDSSQGKLDDATIQWLLGQVDIAIPTLLFIHHPIFEMGVPYMDNNHAGSFSASTIDHLKKFKQLSVFCGHYHIERSLQMAGITVYICPSLYVQIDPKVEDFKPLHYRIGYRTIELQNPAIITSVIYQEGCLH